MKSFIYLILILTQSLLSQDFWVKTSFPTDNSSLYSIYSIIENNNNEILVGTFAQGIFKTGDNGITWNESGLTNMWITSLARDNYGSIYAGAIGSELGSGIFKSIDDGETWTKVFEILTGINKIYVSSNNEIYVGLNYTSEQSGIYYSSDGGANWEKIFNESENIYSILKLNSGRVLAASYGKIYYSDNNGSSWQSSNSGLVSSTPSALEINSENKIYLATLGYGIYESNDDGVNWTNKTGAGWEYSDLTIDNNGIMYASTRGNWVYKSDDNWNSSVLINSGMGQDKYVLDLYIDKNGYLFAGMDYYGFYRSNNPVVVSVENDNLLPSFYLSQNYPNPFNPSTSIDYSVPSNDYVNLKVYDILGNEVAILVNELKQPGNYKVNFNGSKLSSGVYFYKLQVGKYTQVRKMILLK
jgi:photosystem II stability/assembly factor-like uncharacterized protein